MSSLYLTEQGAKLQKEQGRFRVTADQVEVEVPIREVEQVLVFGSVQLTAGAIATCLHYQIPVVFLTQQGGYKGHLWSAECGHAKVEAAQYQRFADEAFQMAMALAVVQGKLWNSKQLLLKLNRQRDLAEVAAAIDGINRDLAAIARLGHTAADLERLRGHEGAAAARYFPALGRLIRHPEFTFSQRHRRPPTDPVNSLLSFGYTLLFNNVLSLLLAEGLNPYLGNLHGSEKRQAFLAFDLVEEFRSPVVDSLVMRLVNQKFLKPTDFTWPNQEGGIYLNDEARRPFLKQFEERLSLKVSHPDVQELVSYRRVIQLQVRRYKQALLSGVPYEAFRKVN